MFLDAFLPAYNAAHGTHYGGDPEEQDHEPWDYRWPSSSQGMPSLYVQLTRAASNEDSERRLPANLRKLYYDEIQQPLLAMRLTGAIVALRVDRLPTAVHERRWVLADVRRLVIESLAQPVGIDEIRVLKPYRAHGAIVRIALESSDPGHSGVSITGPGMYVDPAVVWRAVASLEKKQRRFGHSAKHIVLAILFDLTGYGDADVSTLATEFQSREINFQEVWAVSPWEPDVRADRLWPS